MPMANQVRKGGGRNGPAGTKVVDRKSVKNPQKQVGEAPAPVDGGGGGDAAAGLGHDDDDAIAAFFQEMKQDDADKTHEIRKVSLTAGQNFFRLGPEYIDEQYFECTPVPLYTKTVPILDYNSFLEKSPDEILVITPIRPQTFSALFAFYRDRGPALNWDPNLTDLEEDCFFQEVVSFPTSKLAYALPRERKRDAIKKSRVKVFKPSGDFVIKTRLHVTLQESQTFTLLELTGTLVLEADENIAFAKDKNEKYLQMVKHHLESDSYANDFAQSFENYKLSRYSDYKIRGCIDVGTDCHFYYIEDDYRKVDAEDVKRKIRETDELTAKTLADKAKLDIPESGWKSSSSDDSSDEEEDLSSFRVDMSKYKEDDEDDERQHILEDASEDEIVMSSEEDEEFEINLPLQTVYDHKSHKMRLQGPRIYPDISFSLIALERIISMDSQQQKQADMRGLSAPEEIKVEAPPEEEEPEKPEELDEDAVVNLLIQQHRMQEQMEKSDAEGGEQEVIVMPAEVTEADLERIKAELDDGEAEPGEETEEVRIEVPVKQETVKVEEPVVDEEPEEQDEFDLAYEGLIEEQSETGLEGEGLRKAAVDRSGDSKGDEDLQDTTGKEVRKDEDSLAVSDRYEKHVDDSQGAPRGPTSDGQEGGVVMGDIKCQWDEKAEKDAIAKEEADEAKAKEEIIEEEKLELPEATEDDEELAAFRPPETKITDEDNRKEIIAQMGYQFPELLPSRGGAAADDESKLEGDDENDISDESEVEEDSRLSDHKGLEEMSGYSSSASEDSIAIFKELVVRRSSAGKAFGITREKLEEETQLSTPHPHVRQYWQFKVQQIYGREVTDIAIHPTNENIFAVSYGSFRFGRESTEGLVCIWNAKNNRSPERMYSLRSSATTLAFSEFTPYVLAVGMLDGNIAVFDIRESDCVILGSTYAQEDKHMGPIWQIYWLVEEDSANDDSISESMLSLGDDGYLKRWSMTKGLESSIVMKVMRSTMQIPGRREKRSESLITTLSTAYTVCFFPANPDLFLLGTEEGFIHKCATAYKDQFVSTYVGHTGPVYRICFSSFDETVFVSCGGDWTVKIWKTDFPVPLLSMQTGHRIIFDVACSLYSSTVFICCTEFSIEVWDLSLNTLEPVVQFKPAFDVALRKAAFNKLLNSVIIGDDEGCLSIYGLRNFPKPPTSKIAQNDSLMEALMPGFKRRMKEEPNSGAPIKITSKSKSGVNQASSSKGVEDDGRSKSIRR